MVGYDLGTVVTRKQLCQGRLRRLKTFVLSRVLTFSCLNLLKSGIGSLKFSSEQFSSVFWTYFKVLLLLWFQLNPFFVSHKA